MTCEQCGAPIATVNQQTTGTHDKALGQISTETCVNGHETSRRVYDRSTNLQDDPMPTAALDTVRRALEAAEATAGLIAFQGIEASFRLLTETLRVREASQIPMVSRGAQRRMKIFEEALRQIADPSYVGNYQYGSVIEIHRKWAREALDE